MTSPDQTTNFGFLAEHDPLFVEIAQSAERAFASDPNTTLIKLRQLGEALVQHIAALAGVECDDQTTQADLLFRINRELKLESVVRELFHICVLKATRQRISLGPNIKKPSVVWSSRASLRFGFTSPLAKAVLSSSLAPSFRLPTPALSCPTCKLKSPSSNMSYSKPIRCWIRANSSMSSLPRRKTSLRPWRLPWTKNPAPWLSERRRMKMC